jgi:hypothetical protein
MSPEKQRVAIAQACGWKDCDINWSRSKQEDLLLGSQPIFYNGKIISYLCDQTIPDYPADLNAMHEAEKMLTPEQHIDYMEWLGMCSDDYGRKVWAYVHATASQRAKAFLRTLGLWTVPSTQPQ